MTVPLAPNPIVAGGGRLDHRTARGALAVHIGRFGGGRRRAGQWQSLPERGSPARARRDLGPLGTFVHAGQLPVGGDGGGQGGVDQFRADEFEQAGGLEVVAEVLFDAGQGEGDAAPL
jgi:hypothetical protein